MKPDWRDFEEVETEGEGDESYLHFAAVLGHVEATKKVSSYAMNAVTKKKLHHCDSQRKDMLTLRKC